MSGFLKYTPFQQPQSATNTREPYPGDATRELLLLSAGIGERAIRRAAQQHISDGRQSTGIQSPTRPNVVEHPYRQQVTVWCRTCRGSVDGRSNQHIELGHDVVLEGIRSSE